MPGTNLTRQEAIARRGVVVGTPDYRVSLDVTKGPCPDRRPSST